VTVWQSIGADLKETRQSAARPRPLGGRTSPLAESALAEIGWRAVALDLGAPLCLRVSARARRVCLRIDAARRQVELVLPRGVPAEFGLRLLRDKRGWITARLAALPRPAPFVEGAVVPVLGVPHRIRHSPGRAGPPVVIADGEIRVGGDAAHLPRRVRDHLAGLARDEFARRARPLALSIGRKIGRVSVRDTKSRWGSCSSSGNLSFSWRLIFAPTAIVDYVVAHEVAHLAEMNHSPRFWRLVETLAPGCVPHRRWLDRHRAQLLSYG
jgi:predicted metal-dependent hydrolase